MAHDSPGVVGRPDGPGPVDRPEQVRGPDGPERVEAPVGAVLEPYQRRLDEPDARAGDTPREAIRGFSPERAGLEPITGEEAKQYVRENLADRPWLNHAQYVGKDTCRVLAAVDKGGGHALERHGSTVAPEKLEARAIRLEDPAIADDSARTPGRDAFKPEDQVHTCGSSATRIRDPHAFATCFARGIEHPKVREKLELPFDPDIRPPAVGVPLEDLLGDEGHNYCDGYRLDPVGGSAAAARECREAWVDAIRNDVEPDVPEPSVTRLQPEDFRGSEVRFAFQANRAGNGWEVATMYVDPPRP